MAAYHLDHQELLVSPLRPQLQVAGRLFVDNIAADRLAKLRRPELPDGESLQRTAEGDLLDHSIA